MDRLSRMGRSMNITPILASQIVGDAGELEPLVGSYFAFGVETEAEAERGAGAAPPRHRRRGAAPAADRLSRRPLLLPRHRRAGSCRCGSTRARSCSRRSTRRHAAPRTSTGRGAGRCARRASARSRSPRSLALSPAAPAAAAPAARRRRSRSHGDRHGGSTRRRSGRAAGGGARGLGAPARRRSASWLGAARTRHRQPARGPKPVLRRAASMPAEQRNCRIDRHARGSLSDLQLRLRRPHRHRPRQHRRQLPGAAGPDRERDLDRLPVRAQPRADAARLGVRAHPVHRQRDDARGRPRPASASTRAFTSPWLVVAMVAIGAWGSVAGAGAPRGRRDDRRDAALAGADDRSRCGSSTSRGRRSGRGLELHQRRRRSVLAAPQCGSISDPDGQLRRGDRRGLARR